MNKYGKLICKFVHISVGTLLNNALSLHHGNYLKFIPSVDQLAETLYLIVAQLIAKAQFEKALDHTNDLYKFIQLLKAWESYDSEKMDKKGNWITLFSFI